MKDEQLKMEEIESSHLTHWVDVEGVDDILMSDTLQSVGPTESPDVRVKVWFKKKPWTCVDVRVTNMNMGWVVV